MPTPRKAASELERSGSFDAMPSRRRKDFISTDGLGDCPISFTPEQAEVWHEITSGVPAGVLTSQDRHIVEIASSLMLRFRTTGLKAAETSLLVTCIARLGGTPYDRSKLSQTTGVTEGENPFEQFA